jgi:acyl-CoA synthetase (NDP forming)
MSTPRTLSESDSKRLLSAHGIVTPREHVVADPAGAVAAADALGYPVVLKLVGANLAHKTERGLVRLRVADAAAVEVAARELLARARPDDGEIALLVAEMVAGDRELIAGLVVDAQFGPMVMLGLGGVSAEALDDVVFRPAPLDAVEADAMLDELRSRALFAEFRGQPALSRQHLIDALIALGQLAESVPEIGGVDINPMIVDGRGIPVAVDALVVLDTQAGAVPERVEPADRAGVRALFEPRAVLVTGASSHPGKFGFVALHNILAAGFTGAVHATNLAAEPVLGVRTTRSVDELPAGEIDLAFVCTPAAANAEVLEACAAKGITAAFVTSAGYGEAGEAGRTAERELVTLAHKLGITLAGPNGQGVVSTPARLCAQIVAPYPPAGAIAVASQSGNFVSSFLNLARASGVGISRAVSAGNAAAVGVADYLEYFADDPVTKVSLAYLEGITDGRELMRRLSSVTLRKPLVVLKGGTTAGGARAAASHTGALAADDKLFDGACRAAGVTRAASVDEAFDAAATFATQPSPSGPNVVVLTTAGGWGVVTADAITRDRDLRLLELPPDLAAAIDAELPARWSRNNPVDCAGGETRDTIPTVLRLIAGHPSVDAVIYLGLGIQSNQARTMREGRFFPDHGLERIVDYHERQDQRFAATAAELSRSTGKPILCVTELAVADPSNPGPAAVRASGRYAYPSGERAVVALGHALRDARHRARRQA